MSSVMREHTINIRLSRDEQEKVKILVSFDFEYTLKNIGGFNSKKYGCVYIILTVSVLI